MKKRILNLVFILILFVCGAFVFTACDSENTTNLVLIDYTTTYDGEEVDAYKLVGYYNTNLENVELSYSPNQKFVDAGKYKITVSIISNDYVIESHTAILTIKPLKVEDPSYETSSYVYSGQVISVRSQIVADPNFTEISEYENINAGNYNAVVSLKSKNYCWQDGTSDDILLPYTIQKAQNEWLEEPYAEDIEPNETIKIGFGKAKYGKVRVAFANVNDRIFTSETPMLRGQYVARFLVETENYDTLIKYAQFNIGKVTTQTDNTSSSSGSSTSSGSGSSTSNRGDNMGEIPDSWWESGSGNSNPYDPAADDIFDDFGPWTDGTNSSTEPEIGVGWDSSWSVDDEDGWNPYNKDDLDNCGEDIDWPEADYIFDDWGVNDEDAFDIDKWFVDGAGNNENSTGYAEAQSWDPDRPLPPEFEAEDHVDDANAGWGEARDWPDEFSPIYDEFSNDADHEFYGEETDLDDNSSSQNKGSNEVAIELDDDFWTENEPQENNSQWNHEWDEMLDNYPDVNYGEDQDWNDREFPEDEFSEESNDSQNVNNNKNTYYTNGDYDMDTWW